MSETLQTDAQREENTGDFQIQAGAQKKKKLP